MAEDKPKYIRKKCEHNRYSFQCKDCKGSSICPHDRKRNICKECNGNGLCPHQRIKQHCIECDGVSICEHKKRRSRCIECKGGSICPHEKLRSRCMDCNGSEICEHQRRRQICIECNGSQVCPHQLRKSRCAECNGTEICIHKNNKYICIECHGKNVCEHNKLQNQCTQCKGSLICEHGTRKSICKDCGGAYVCEHEKQRNQCIICTPSSACQHCQAISILSSHWKPFCFRCYCVLHPDAVIPRKFKLKENYVVEALKEQFQETVTMVIDKKVEGGCSRRRPDVSIDFGSHCLMIEIDEKQHSSYACEEKRMMDLFEDVGFRKIIFLRFNPDSYRYHGTLYRSPFSYTPTGILKLNQEEFDRRMAELVARIRVHSQEPAELFTVEFLFFH